MNLNKLRLRCVFPILGLLICGRLFAQPFLFLESKLMTLREASAPEYHDGKLLLTYRAANPVRYVGARFEHEDFRVLHIYKRNANNVFFLVYQVPENFSLLKYRIVVDGLLMSDPFNPNEKSDGTLEVSYSYYVIDEVWHKRISSPERVGLNEVCFTYRGRPGQNVILLGDFNNWDPFAHPLEERSPNSGIYFICVSLGPGVHRYIYLVDGMRTPDPLNRRRIFDGDGNEVSFFGAPRREEFNQSSQLR